MIRMELVSDPNNYEDKFVRVEVVAPGRIGPAADADANFAGCRDCNHGNTLSRGCAMRCQCRKLQAQAVTPVSRVRTQPSMRQLRSGCCCMR